MFHRLGQVCSFQRDPLKPHIQRHYTLGSLPFLGFQGISYMGWRDASVANSTGCYVGPGHSIPNTHTVAGSEHALLASVGTGHIWHTGVCVQAKQIRGKRYLQKQKQKPHEFMSRDTKTKSSK